MKIQDIINAPDAQAYMAEDLQELADLEEFCSYLDKLNEQYKDAKLISCVDLGADYF